MDETRFLLDHEDEIDSIDKLLSLRLIERDNTGQFIVPFFAISSLRGKAAIADQIINSCSKVFTALKDEFRKDSNKNILISELEKSTSLSKDQVRIALSYLTVIPLWANKSPDFSSSQAFVRASTGILRYKTFDDVLAQLEQWNRPPTIPSSLVSLSTAIREKQQKFGILDSPSLLEDDLSIPAGTLGRVVLYIDLDNFKTLNTTLSEVVVDRDILPVVHKELVSIVERIGYSYAEGGDEFIVLLPNSTLEMSKAFALELGNRIRAISFAGVAADTSITASIGIAHENATGDGLLIKEQANLAMRRAKADGKDQVQVWRGDEPLEVEVNPRKREILPRQDQILKKSATTYTLQPDDIEVMKFIGDKRSATSSDIQAGLNMHSVQVEHLLGRLLKSAHLEQQHVPLVGAMYVLSDSGNAYLVENKLIPLKSSANVGARPDNPKGHRCDHCGSIQLRRTGSKSDPTFGDLGVKMALYSCISCGKESGFTDDK